MAAGMCAVLAACGGPFAAQREGQLEGTIAVTPSSRGDAWVFLYPPGAGFPLTQAFPDRVTAVPDLA